MKKTSAFFPLLASSALAFVMWEGSGCKTTSEAEIPQTFTVIGISGDARYADDQSKTWRTLKSGNHISQGSVLQTASGAGNAVLLVAGERFVPAIPLDPRPYDHANKLILYENSILKIHKLTLKTLGEKKIWDTRLSLLAGSALCDAHTVWPSDAGIDVPMPAGPKVKFIKPEPDKNYYEIRSSNIVVHAEHAVFFLAPSRVTRLVQGAVTIEFADTGATKDLFAPQQYDFATDEISQIDFNPAARGFPSPAWKWLRPRVPQPAYEIPQRPF